MKVWVAVIAVGDDHNDPTSEIVGVFPSEQDALEAGRGVGPRTAEALEFTLGEVPAWASPASH
jgi:hypothetical protein